MGIFILMVMANTLFLAGAKTPELEWVSVNDNVMGGQSSGTFRYFPEALVFTGSLNTNGGGFASIRTVPRPLHLEDETALQLEVRGDGRTYKVRLFTDTTKASYFAEITPLAGQWQTVSLPFADFRASWRGRLLDLPAVTPATIVGVGLMVADKRDGAFELQVRKIIAV
jgi:NADH dehydrogenase [ubiquinone] 1 alpha subcomplex assembly factor 1